MNLGIYGGTFDPVHLGHLILAETVREVCLLEEVWFMPARQPPHKQNANVTSARQRMQMLEFGIAGHPQFRTSDLEIRRDGPSFTVDTLRTLHEQRPDDTLHLLIGADSLEDFPTWKAPTEILELATVVAVNRGRSETHLPTVLDQLGQEYAERFRIVQMPAIDLSSTELRQRCQDGRSIRYQVPRSVELYIQQQGLYA